MQVEWSTVEQSSRENISEMGVGAFHDLECGSVALLRMIRLHRSTL